MKTIRLSQVALLGWALLMATASASVQQEQSWLWNAGGVELKLPSTWQEISPSLLRGKVSALGMGADHVYGAQTLKAGDTLLIPIC
jgi:ABC-type nitrate/sulfonate/bicarbonate transport system substrate-binding protein